ncbi:RNA polymerase recycling motor HelD [Paenibacillus alginolyticus]|uniref:UvrD-helicase domain-containing protein n=1 Tax=Paenibacillus alginolyticus TaxID=59839 RepID=A0ABT4GIR5_9BACL|nr:RNA polymerase recycling motor HelD [Paenibacillus alginolyticus]MCY9696006.1 UvrD-helicase domain-containing protein [Paenibacillus alginolyticus]MEC0143430.1 RNA polymerase recycling motor HelD [Paenibacillus alginolyticus]
MNLTEQDWADEEQRVQEVTAKIRIRMTGLEDEVGKVQSDVVEIRKHYWDEVTMDMSTAEDAAESIASMRQQAEVLSERERTHRQAAVALGKLKRLVNSPYFGRIDFKERDERQGEAIYLGIAGFLDEQEDHYLVYDWRAPISSLYYDYAPGEVAFTTPNGMVEGQMLLKRQFVIRDSHIQLMFDTGVTIGDELLKQVLSRSSDAQMKTIVATIQKEQNRIIRNDKAQMLIVQGVAGSGKTSAALQRVAYLLYKHRDLLSSDQMVLFSPNPLFNHYVSTVLPELGEENMQQTTYQAYLEHRLGEEFEVEDSFTQLEYLLARECSSENGENAQEHIPQRDEEIDYNARLSGIHYKSSLKFLAVIHAYQERLMHAGMLFNPIKFREKEVLSAARLVERFYSYDPAIRLPNRLELMQGWMLEQLELFAELQLEEAWVEEEIELLSSEDYHLAYLKLRKMERGHGATFDDFDQERVLLARVVIKEHLKLVRSAVKRLEFVDLRGLYGQLFREEVREEKTMHEWKGDQGNKPPYWSAICERTLKELAQARLPYEDATPFLYMMEAVCGFQTNGSVRHVIIDEAQDYSPFQLAYLKRLFPRCRMTALGDLNQAIYSHASAYSEIDPIAALYGPEQTEVIRLHRSYRSTRELVEFTRGIVPGGDAIEPFTRSGAKPRVIKVSDRGSLHSLLAAEIDRLLGEGYASIAIIGKTASESKLAHQALEPQLQVPLGLITKHSPTFESGVLVIPSYLAKGVEFDAVLVYDGSRHQYGHENERKLFYTACTRAMHELCMFSLGEPSGFITDQPQEVYEYIDLTLSGVSDSRS